MGLWAVSFGRKASEALGNRWIKKILEKLCSIFTHSVFFLLFFCKSLANLECFPKLSEMVIFYLMFSQTERFKAEQMVEI